VLVLASVFVSLSLSSSGWVDLIGLCVFVCMFVCVCGRKRVRGMLFEAELGKLGEIKPAGWQGPQKPCI